MSNSNLISWSGNSNVIPVLNTAPVSQGSVFVSNYLSGEYIDENGVTRSLDDIHNSDISENENKDMCVKMKLENPEINDIRSIISLIYNTFSKKSQYINSFFFIGSKERMCFHYMKSLPIFRLSLFKDGSGNVSFSSDWNGDVRFYDGWEMAPQAEPEEVAAKNKNTKINAKSVFVIPSVSEINIYEWGFEILNEGGIQLISILSYAIDDKPDHTIGLKNWKPPFKKEYTQTDDYKRVIASWKKP